MNKDDIRKRIAENAEKKRKYIESLDIDELKHAMAVNDPRGQNRGVATPEQKRIWYSSYDALEAKLSDEEFEDFLDTLD